MVKRIKELDGSTIMIGTASEIKRGIQNMEQMKNVYSSYEKPPKFNDTRMYGVRIERQENGTFKWIVLSSDAIVRRLVEGVLVDWDNFYKEVN